MNNIKPKFNIFLLGIMAVGLFASCDEGGEPDPGGTNVEEFAGDWYVTVTDTEGGVAAEHARFSTYNTAANDNTMWIDDHTNGWWLKGRVTVNPDGTFASNGAVPNIIVTPDESDPGIVTITEGKIIKDGGLTRGGHVVDSIYFKAFYDYEGEDFDIELIHGGHKRTGFLEDEY